MNPMITFADNVADTVLAKYDTLPAKRKPTVDGNGVSNWVPLSAIVLTRGETDITCASIATGMKCLPANKVPEARGLVLHDWHAEILAIRAFNHFLITECHKLAKSTDASSSYVRRREAHEITQSRGLQPFTVDQDLEIQMYCSEAPCGDASMELIMNAQEDATPWPTPVSPAEATSPSELLKGRGYFGELGVVRRKPSRTDSPPTLSKSCSDKLALKQCTSLLSSPASLLISPENAYLKRLILPSSQYVQPACERAFSGSGRMRPVEGKDWPGGFAFHPFEVETTTREFRYSRRGVGTSSAAVKGSNISAVYTPGLQETLINGVLQGRKQFNPKGGSAFCRAKTWKAVLEVIALLAIPALTHLSNPSRYSGLKNNELLADRNRVKKNVRSEALRGWIRNHGDDFELDPT